MRKTIREKCCHNDSKEDCYDCPFREVPRISLQEKSSIDASGNFLQNIRK
jgi:hypothetical protein